HQIINPVEHAQGWHQQHRHPMLLLLWNDGLAVEHKRLQILMRVVAQFHQAVPIHHVMGGFVGDDKFFRMGAAFHRMADKIESRFPQRSGVCRCAVHGACALNSQAETMPKRRKRPPARMGRDLEVVGGNDTLQQQKSNDHSIRALGEPVSPTLVGIKSSSNRCWFGKPEPQSYFAASVSAWRYSKKCCWLWRCAWWKPCSVSIV